MKSPVGRFYVGRAYVWYDEAMIIVTAGERYIDIDAYACAVAYAELLNLLGKPAIAASSAVWNESITTSLRALRTPLVTGHRPMPGDQFVMVDVSYPSQFDTFVDQQHIIEVFDHRAGFEEYWTERLGNDSHIEFIGAAATLIYEAWAKAGVVNRMSKQSARLLAAAILDNTLDFKAGVTTDRDKTAYAFLARHADLSDQWAADYFTDCQAAILADLPRALQNDTKLLTFSGLEGQLCLGQIVVWNAQEVIADRLETISAVLGELRPLWLANVVSISEGKSYFVAGDQRVRSWAERLLNVHFIGNIATADTLWLRKEIIKQDKERTSQQK